MNRRSAAVLTCLTGVIVLSAGYSWAGAKPAKPDSKIGIVSIRRIFQECKRNEKYKKDAMAEQDKIAAELDKLAKEIEAEKAELKTLKENSTDYMTRLKGIFEKQANLQAQKEFQKQNMELKDQKWTEGIYKDIIRITADVAKQKGLELVFEESEVDLEGASVNEVMLTIRTHKLLYSDGCADITNDVIAKLDTAEDEKPKTQTDQQKTDSKN